MSVSDDDVPTSVTYRVHCKVMLCILELLLQPVIFTSLLAHLTRLNHPAPLCVYGLSRVRFRHHATKSSQPSSLWTQSYRALAELYHVTQSRAVPGRACRVAPGKDRYSGQREAADSTITGSLSFRTAADSLRRLGPDACRTWKTLLEGRDSTESSVM